MLSSKVKAALINVCSAEKKFLSRNKGILPLLFANNCVGAMAWNDRGIDIELVKLLFD